MEEEARQRLLRVALRLFVERGYAATTVREIVAGAGVTKPVLYYHFKNKEGLYLEIMNGITTIFEQRVAELGNTQGTIRERLIHFLGGLLDGAREQLDAVRLAYSIFFGPPQGAPYVDFERFFDRILEIVEALLKEGMACGELATGNSWLKTWVIVGAYNTIMEEQLCRKTPRIGKESLIEIIMLQLATPGSTERKV